MEGLITCSGGLSLEGNLSFKIDWVCLIVERKFTVFALFYFVNVIQGNFQVQALGGGLHLKWRFKGGFFALQVWWGLYLEGIIHGGAYFRNLTVPYIEIKTPFLSCYHLLVYQTS